MPPVRQRPPVYPVLSDDSQSRGARREARGPALRGRRAGGRTLRRQGLPVLESAHDRYGEGEPPQHEPGGGADIRRADAAERTVPRVRPLPANGRASLRVRPRPAPRGGAVRRRQGRAVPGQLPAGGQAQDRARPVRGPAAGRHDHQRDGAWHRHRRPGRHRADRVPGKHSQHVAAGGQKRPGRRAVPERARGPGRPARPVPDEVSGRLLRQAHGERAHISGEPVRPQAPPALRRLRGAAHDVRHRLLRSRPAAGSRRDGGRRPAGGEGRTVAPAARRLVSRTGRERTLHVGPLLHAGRAGERRRAGDGWRR